MRAARSPATRSSRATAARVSMCAAAALLGCGELVDLDVASVEQADDPACGYLACAKSPEVLYHGMFDASLRGDANAQGIAIAAAYGQAQIYKDGVGYDLTVEGSRIFGARAGRPLLAGPALAGARIELVRDGAPLDTIEISGVREIAYPYGPAEPLEVYRMTWLAKDGTPSGTPVCNALVWRGDGAYAERELLGMERDEVLVFEGDRVDPDALAMSEAVDSGWFNFGCAGRALAKLHLTRNTAASSVEPDPTRAWRQRQALLKLLAADYCGTGRAFTLPGEEVAWRGGLVGFHAAPGALEARWGEAGALCLGAPRLRDHPRATELFGELRQAIAAECPALPPCADADPRDLAGALFVSAGVE